MVRVGTTVLVEDNEDHALLTRWALADPGDTGKVVWLRDGEEALRYLVEKTPSLACTCPPDLILLDIDLPKINGKEVLRRIRACGGLRDTPVVILTTSDDERDMVECYSLGADNYIVKPARLEELSDKLKAFRRHIYRESAPHAGGAV